MSTLLTQLCCFTAIPEVQIGTVCCILNKRSGGHKGEQIFEYLIKKEQYHVFDILELPDEQILSNQELFGKLKKLFFQTSDTRVLVGGGDGSIIRVFEIFDLILNVMRSSPELTDEEKLRLTPPPVGILPLGVGNELSRCIGWSSTCNGSKSTIESYIRDLFSGPAVLLDRWNIRIESNSPDDLVSLPAGSDFQKGKAMLCFFSIGFDASISHKFHKLRESNPGFCSSVAINKFWHTFYGAGEFVLPSNYISNSLEIFVEGKRVPISHDLRTLQILNIHSSADGVDFFGQGPSSKSDLLQEYSKPKVNDSLLEVVGTEGVFHLLTTRVKLTHSKRLAQGSQITIVVSAPLPAQLDGEPFIIPPCTVHISPRDQVSVVQGSGSIRNLY